MTDSNSLCDVGGIFNLCLNQRNCTAFIGDREMNGFALSWEVGRYRFVYCFRGNRNEIASSRKIGKFFV